MLLTLKGLWKDLGYCASMSLMDRTLHISGMFTEFDNVNIEDKKANNEREK